MENAKVHIVVFNAYTIRTTVTNNVSAATQWIHDSINERRLELSHRDERVLVGMGVMWRRNSPRAAATVQVCTYEKCLIYQLSRVESCSLNLRRLLLDREIVLVGIDIFFYATMLKEPPHGVALKDEVVDIRTVASELRGFNVNATMTMLTEQILGIQGMIEDEELAYNSWEVEELSYRQVSYASINAFISFLIGRELQVWNKNQSQNLMSSMKPTRLDIQVTTTMVQYMLP